MPISEDEFDYRQQEAVVTMSKAELRKTHKPIMEKRRRARINHCLNEIKSLILEAMNKDPARHSKLEKADILEMAVKHLQNVQRQQLALAMASDPSVLRKFKSGFSECASEIDRYVNQTEGVDSGVKERMRSHLQKCITGIEQVAHFSGFAGLPFVAPAQSSGDQNNNARLQSIQLIPSRLPSGELALVLPNSTSLPFRPSAFAAVVPGSSSAISPQDEHVSSSMEVKNVTFPIHNFASPRKVAEPLCIITNQSERFKQAQPRADSVEFEENRQVGVKRKLQEPQGLLTFVPQPAAKIAKVETVTSGAQPSTSRQDNNARQDGNDSNSDMWRPW